MSKVSPQATATKEAAPKTVERRRSSSDREHDGIQIQISRRAYVLLYSVIAAPILVGLGVFLGQHNWTFGSKKPQPQAPTTGLQPAVPTTRTYLNPGPWGTVEYV